MIIKYRVNALSQQLIEIMEQKLPEYVIKYQSTGYDEIEVLSRKFNQKMESFIENKYAISSHAFEL